MPLKTELPNIYLIGFMGSGKTYWGKKWSATQGLAFHDLDDIIETQEDKSIARIFEEQGEAHFRDLETRALQELAGTNSIIAVGGGTACFNDNISWMNEYGTSVYLHSSPENILGRLAGEKNKRPLIKHLRDDELLFYIREKIKEREPFYHQAKITVNVDDIPGDYLPGFFNDYA